MLHPMSNEQYNVYSHMKEGKNVIVDACAGSGKSTTILSIAKEMETTKILQFTYNSMLRHEIREKVQELELDNLEVHTYHSFSVKYYSSQAHTDTGIRAFLRSKTPPRSPLNLYDLVVLDECQDMTLLYFEMVATMIRDMCKAMDHKIQLLILGDYMQGLYEFKGADIRFLTKASECWEGFQYLKQPDFVQATLQTSYRITNQMADFVNKDMLGEQRIHACREGGPIVYIRRPRYLLEKIVVYNIKQLLEQGESPSDIFVLGGSVKGPNSPIRKMENVLTQNDIPCHVPMFETDAMDERVIEGKVVFSTFHTVKGRQRKYVFVVGFDNSYYFIARDLQRDICPNTLYVATTRATHGLFLLDNDSSAPLDFLKQNQHVMKQCQYIDFKGMPQTIFHDRNSLKDDSIELIPTYHVSPTELIKFLSEDLLETITPKIDALFSLENGEEEHELLEIPKVHYTGQGFFEDVSDLNGIALPAYYYDKIDPDAQEGEQSIRKLIQKSVIEMREKDHDFLRKKMEELPEKCESIQDYLHLSNVYVAFQEKLYFKLKQIKRADYVWIDNDLLEKCTKRFDDFLKHEYETSEKPSIEYSLIHYNQDGLQEPLEKALFPYFENTMKFKFAARLDLLSKTTIYEMKCTSAITMEHKLQVILYAWIWAHLHPTEYRKIMIYNVRTNEKWVLKADLHSWTFIVVELLKHKYEKRVVLENDDFVGKCKDVLDKISVQEENVEKIAENG